MPLPTPTVQILKSIKRTLRAIDWAAAGYPGLLVRHMRRRFPTPEETPCISIRWVSDEPRQADQNDGYYTADEMVVEMMVELLIDAKILPDPDDESLDDDEMLDADPTGLGPISDIAAIANRALRADDADIKLFSDDVFDRGRSDDDDGTADMARFVQVVIVQYRVLVRDPSQLLAQGAHA